MKLGGKAKGKCCPIKLNCKIEEECCPIRLGDKTERGEKHYPKRLDCKIIDKALL